MNRVSKSAQFSNLLKNQRRSKGLSQSTLAEQSGVSLPMIQLIEANNTNPSLDLVERLSLALDLEILIQKKHSSLEILAQSFGLIEAAQKHDLTKKQLIFHLEEGRIELKGNVDPRLKETFDAIKLCVEEYYPSVFGRKLVLHVFPEGKIVKLKRIALPYLMKVMES